LGTLAEIAESRNKSSGYLEGWDRSQRKRDPKAINQYQPISNKEKTK